MKIPEAPFKPEECYFSEALLIVVVFPTFHVAFQRKRMIFFRSAIGVLNRQFGSLIFRMTVTLSPLRNIESTASRLDQQLCRIKMDVALTISTFCITEHLSPCKYHFCSKYTTARFLIACQTYICSSRLPLFLSLLFFKAFDGSLFLRQCAGLVRQWPLASNCWRWSVMSNRAQVSRRL